MKRVKLKRSIQKKDFWQNKLFQALTLASWLGLISLAIFVSPQSWGIILAFFLLLLLSLSLSLFLVFRVFVFSALVGFYLCFLLFLQLLDQLHLLNIVLLTAFLIVVWVELKKQSKTG